MRIIRNQFRRHLPNKKYIPSILHYFQHPGLCVNIFRLFHQTTFPAQLKTALRDYKSFAIFYSHLYMNRRQFLAIQLNTLESEMKNFSTCSWHCSYFLHQRFYFRSHRGTHIYVTIQNIHSTEKKKTKEQLNEKFFTNLKAI